MSDGRRISDAFLYGRREKRFDRHGVKVDTFTTPRVSVYQLEHRPGVPGAQVEAALSVIPPRVREREWDRFVSDRGNVVVQFVEELGGSPER